jgi:hypothetical protein
MIKIQNIKGYDETIGRLRHAYNNYVTEKTKIER